MLAFRLHRVYESGCCEVKCVITVRFLDSNGPSVEQFLNGEAFSIVVNGCQALRAFFPKASFVVNVVDSCNSVTGSVGPWNKNTGVK